MSLVDDRGIGIAVAKDDLPGLERGPDHFDHMLRSVGEKKEELGKRIDRSAVEQHSTNRAADRAVAGLAGRADRIAFFAQDVGDPRDGGRLSRAVRSFKRHEHAPILRIGAS